MGFDAHIFNHVRDEVAYFRKQFPLNSFFYNAMVQRNDPEEVAYRRQHGDLCMKVDDAMLIAAMKEFAGEDHIYDQLSAALREFYLGADLVYVTST